jgi:hypothetical protein
VLTSQYIHPEFGFFCLASRLRRTLRVALACLLVAGVGATKMAPADRPNSDAAATRIDVASMVETVPATSLTPFVPLSSNLTVVEGTQPASDKPRCVGDALADLDGNCVSIKLRKPRMVRVATDRAATAAVALGRTASLPDSNIDPALPAASAGREGDPEKSGQAASAPVAVAGSTERCSSGRSKGAPWASQDSRVISQCRELQQSASCASSKSAGLFHATGAGSSFLSIVLISLGWWRRWSG